jgi:hypothetical protein
MTGTIKFDNIVYDETGIGMGFHIATGFDWLISRRFTASLRGGYRFMSIEEQHKDESATYGYESFYTSQGDKVTIKMNGPYLSFGLQWSFYSKQKSLTPQE